MRRHELEMGDTPDKTTAGRAASADEFLHSALRPVKTRFGACYELYTEEGTATFRSQDTGKGCK